MRRHSRNKAQWLTQNRPSKQTKQKGNCEKEEVQRTVVVLGAVGEVDVDAVGGQAAVVDAVGELVVVFDVVLSRRSWSRARRTFQTCHFS